ncbi:MAG: hypothetical protein O2868_18155 [Proteobacteria bacterium]|nr:hypothetical protein [Pseudomonadota bacterium]
MASIIGDTTGNKSMCPSLILAVLPEGWYFSVCWPITPDPGFQRHPYASLSVSFVPGIDVAVPRDSIFPARWPGNVSKPWSSLLDVLSARTLSSKHFRDHNNGKS